MSAEGGPPPFVPFGAGKGAASKGRIHNNEKSKGRIFDQMFLSMLSLGRRGQVICWAFQLFVNLLCNIPSL